MTELAGQILRRIETCGPITLSEFMADCLFHPTLGYYTGAEVFGKGGDFTTAPEISQMFGEMIGLALAASWLDQGCPAPFTLAELGPGRGTLMADVLRSTRQVPGFHDALDLHFVEASPRLRELQRAAVGNAVGNTGATWHDTAANLPERPLWLIANEFFDALPIRQFLRTGGGWRERMVTVRDGSLAFALSDIAPVAALAPRLPDTSDGDVVEICPALPAIVEEAGRRVARHGGAAIVVDYGGWRSLGDTFQALRDHRRTDPLAEPGRADLTAHVDFEQIARAAVSAGAATTPLTTQGVFLERLGITERAKALASRLPDGPALENHIAAHRRLTHPEEMGSLFKTIALFPPDKPQPPGFER